MQTLKNKILIKLIFIISILMIVALNLFGKIEESIEFNYYYYTNKIYHSTLKTEIIPSDYVFINTSSNESRYKNIHSYIYNLKTKEKKLFYTYKYMNNKEYEYYDIKGNLTTNWTDTNMKANGFYEITNNRFGETFYTLKFDSYDYEGKKLTTTIRINKDNDYIQKAYKYSLTQPEIINKKDRGVYLFNIGDYLCFQNEYYKNSDSYYNSFTESDLLNYDSNGRVKVYEYHPMMYYSFSIYNSFIKQWVTIGGANNDLTNTVYFQLDNKSLIKPTWDEFTNDFLNYIKPKSKSEKLFYTKEDIKENLQSYNVIIAHTKYLWFIPIEEFEYYLLAD